MKGFVRLAERLVRPIVGRGTARLVPISIALVLLVLTLAGAGVAAADNYKY